MKNPLSAGRRGLAAPAILLGALLGAGCATPPVPDAQIAVSRSAIEDAMSAGATQAAPLELQHARDRMAQADAAVDAKRYDDARRLAEEAEVDARLATAKARTARANLAVAEIQKSIRALRENVTPNATPSTSPEAP